MRASTNIISARLAAVFRFYRDGFAGMTLGRTLWRIVIIKMVILFGVVRLFFMHDFLSRFGTEQERAGYVGDRLIAAVPVHRGVKPKEGGEQ